MLTKDIRSVLVAALTLVIVGVASMPEAKATGCKKSDCDFTTCKYFCPAPDILYPFNPPVQDASPSCKDCDGVAEDADGRDHGTCVSNYYDFETQYYNCVNSTTFQQTKSGDCYDKYPIHKGLVCGTYPAP